MNRLKKELNKRNINYKIEPVRYFSGNFKIGENYSPFNKQVSHSFENEVRLLIESYGDQPIEFRIGNISDISKLIPSWKLYTLEIEYINKLSEFYDINDN